MRLQNQPMRPPGPNTGKTRENPTIRKTEPEFQLQPLRIGTKIPLTHPVGTKRPSVAGFKAPNDTAWVCGLKLCLGLKSVEDKSNVIPAVQPLIDLLDLKRSGRHGRRHALPSRNGGQDRGQRGGLHSHCQREPRNAAIGDPRNSGECLRGTESSSATETNRDREETREVVVMPVPKNSNVFSR